MAINGIHWLIRFGIRVVALIVVTLYHAWPQSNSQMTIQALRFERPEQVGTYITLEPPAATLTPFAIQLSADTPRVGTGLYVSGTSPHVSTWTYHSGAIIELATTGSGNLRRMGASLAPGSAAAVPGAYSLDLQAFRSTSSQTASGTYSLVFAGSQNQASGDNSSVGGGSQNWARTEQDAIIGGSNNQAEGRNNNPTQRARGGMLGGSDNFMSGYECVLFGGLANYLSAGATGNRERSTLGGGQLDTVLGSYATLLGGFDNNANGLNSVVLGGANNSALAANSVIPGGRNAVLKQSESFAYNAGPETFSVNTSGEFFINNAHVVLGGSGGGQSELRFYEPLGTPTISTTGTFNYVALKGPTATIDDLNTTYTLPVGTSTSVPVALSIAAEPTSTAANLRWQRYPTTTVGAVTANAGTTNIASATLDAGEFITINSNAAPPGRQVTLANGLTDGFVVTLRVYNANANFGIRIVDGGNVNLAGTANATLDQYDTITFVWDAASAVWLEVARSTN
jgi:hypothetical protein